jgi:very-short-patch-repair endonuclease
VKSRPGDTPEFLARLAEFEAKHGEVKRTRRAARHAPKRELTAEETFAQAWESDPMPGTEMVRELVFYPERKWRFDFAWPGAMLALELEGVGRHQTFIGYRNDCEKYNAATLLGWRVLRFMSADKKHAAEWLRTVKLALCGLSD